MLEGATVGGVVTVGVVLGPTGRQVEGRLLRERHVAEQRHLDLAEDLLHRVLTAGDPRGREAPEVVVLGFDIRHVVDALLAPLSAEHRLHLAGRQREQRTIDIERCALAFIDGRTLGVLRYEVEDVLRQRAAQHGVGGRQVRRYAIRDLREHRRSASDGAGGGVDDDAVDGCLDPIVQPLSLGIGAFGATETDREVVLPRGGQITFQTREDVVALDVDLSFRVEQVVARQYRLEAGGAQGPDGVQRRRERVIGMQRAIVEGHRVHEREELPVAR